MNSDSGESFSKTLAKRVPFFCSEDGFDVHDGSDDGDERFGRSPELRWSFVALLSLAAPALVRQAAPAPRLLLRLPRWAAPALARWAAPAA
jgi:hypothetical protein